MATEDSITIAECLAREKSPVEIPQMMSAYENIRKPRAEKIKDASEFSGVEKHYPDGEKQRKRDKGIKAHMNAQVTVLEKVAVMSSAWVLGHDVKCYVSGAFESPFGINTDKYRQMLSLIISLRLESSR
jgi:salicylate hydroxylase